MKEEQNMPQVSNGKGFTFSYHLTDGLTQVLTFTVPEGYQKVIIRLEGYNKVMFTGNASQHFFVKMDSLEPYNADLYGDHTLAYDIPSNRHFTLEVCMSRASMSHSAAGSLSLECI